MRTQSSGQSPLLMLDVIDLLHQTKISYAVIGAMAASFYGNVRASMDADVVISIGRGQAQINRLKGCLEQLGLKVLVKRGSAEDPLIGVILVEDKYGNQVDIILGIKGMEKDAFKRVQRGKFQGEDINIIGLEDFIAMKIFAGSTKDINDAKGVIEISGQDIDHDLLEKITLQYGEEQLEKLKRLI